ncbi:MAG: enoyl-CoA hydratase/isomerase family protein [Candidatus Eremiobacteraeota bacterium]|nr:enoyl-CoA hydratase/isomerase family protein [Candidatus Eremiobacteraeota bacterium]
MAQTQAPAYSNILVEIQNGIALVTINRPPANALSKATIEELNGAFDALEKDATVRVVIVTGAGQYVFIGGADIGEFVGLDEGAARASVQRGHELFSKIEHFAKPVIAAINGVCVGGGNELAMSCDIRIAAESAKLGQPEVNLGIIPGWGGSQRLPRLVGKGRALEMMLTGDLITADAAARYGLVNKVVPDNEVLTHARNLARKLSMGAPLAMRYIKETTNAGLEKGFDAGLAAEADAVKAIFASNDAKEGVAAFLGKRRPKFTGS